MKRKTQANFAQLLHAKVVRASKMRCRGWRRAVNRKNQGGRSDRKPYNQVRQKPAHGVLKTQGIFLLE